MGEPVSVVALILLSVLFAAAALAAALTAGLSLAGIDPDAGRIANRMVSGQRERALVTRWLQRSRWFRYIGGFAGGIFGAFTLASAGAALTAGLLGVAAGSLLAEAHLLSSTERKPAQRRLIDLRARRATEYWSTRDQFALGLLAIIALAVILTAFGSSDMELRAAWAFGALGIIGICLMCQWRTATRKRPALAESLRNADDLIRHLAITRGMAKPTLVAALVMLAKAVAHPASDGSEQDVVSLGFWLIALTVFWRNRGLGLDDFANPTDPQIPNEAAAT